MLPRAPGEFFWGHLGCGQVRAQGEPPQLSEAGPPRQDAAGSSKGLSVQSNSQAPKGIGMPGRWGQIIYEGGKE